jgi:hypothetical protein
VASHGAYSPFVNMLKHRSYGSRFDQDKPGDAFIGPNVSVRINKKKPNPLLAQKSRLLLRIAASIKANHFFAFLCVQGRQKKMAAVELSWIFRKEP